MDYWILGICLYVAWYINTEFWSNLIPSTSEQCSVWSCRQHHPNSFASLFYNIIHLRRQLSRKICVLLESRLYNYYNFQALSQYCEKPLWALSCLAGRPYRKIRLPLEGFSWNMVFVYFSKSCQKFNFYETLTRITSTLHEGLCTFMINNILLNSS